MSEMVSETVIRLTLWQRMVRGTRIQGSCPGSEFQLEGPYLHD